MENHYTNLLEVPPRLSPNQVEYFELVFYENIPRKTAVELVKSPKKTNKSRVGMSRSWVDNWIRVLQKQWGVRGEWQLLVKLVRLGIIEYNRVWRPKKIEPRLTKREKEVLDTYFYLACFSHKETGEILKISENTVDAHITNIFNKFNVHCLWHLMIAAEIKIERIPI